MSERLETSCISQKLDDIHYYEYTLRDRVAQITDFFIIHQSLNVVADRLERRALYIGGKPPLSII